MEQNGTLLGKEVAGAFLGLFLFGLLYNLLVEKFQKRTQRYTAELVVGGVLITVLASGFIIGWNNAAIVLGLFVASGLPMIVGSWVRSARDDEEAKRIAQRTLNENGQENHK